MFCERIFQKAANNGRKTKKITEVCYSVKQLEDFEMPLLAGNTA